MDRAEPKYELIEMVVPGPWLPWIYYEGMAMLLGGFVVRQFAQVA